MKIFSIICIAMIGITFSWIRCSKSQPVEEIDLEDLKKEIIKIDKEMQDLTAPGGLFRYPFFQKMHKNPQSYLSGILALVSSNDLTDQQKIIAVLAMQKLKLKAYVDFGKQMLIFREEGKVSNPVFKWAIFPPYDWNTHLANNYRSRSVKEVLNQILNSNYIEETLKEFIREEIQTGNGRKQIKYLKEIGQIK